MLKLDQQIHSHLTLKDSEKVAMPWENYPTAEDKRTEAEENSEDNDSEEE